MKNAATSIFRPQAVRQYAERSAEPVFPKSAMPRAFTMLWALLGGLAFLAWLGLCSRVPTYVRGVAAFSLSDRYDQSRPLVAIFVPAEQVTRLRIGQRVLIRTAAPGSAETARITVVYSGIPTPQEIQDLADNTASAALTVAGSRAVALAELDPASSEVSARGSFPGGREALVEVGSRRVLSMVRWGDRPVDCR